MTYTNEGAPDTIHRSGQERERASRRVVRARKALGTSVLVSSRSGVEVGVGCASGATGLRFGIAGSGLFARESMRVRRWKGKLGSHVGGGRDTGGSSRRESVGTCRCRHSPGGRAMQARGVVGLTSLGVHWHWAKREVEVDVDVDA